MISYLLNVFLLGVLFPDFLERRFPNEFRNIVMTLSYNCIYYYSKLQIILMRYNRHINNIVDSNPVLLKLKNDINNLLVRNRNSILEYKFVKNGIQVDFTENYDFVISSSLKDNFRLKMIHFNSDYTQNDFNESNFKFVLIELKVGDKKYKITLKNEDYSYYVTGNKLTKEFFIFYLSHYLNTELSSDESNDLSIVILDNNINMFEYKFTEKNQGIVIEKNGYKWDDNNNNNE